MSDMERYGIDDVDSISKLGEDTANALSCAENAEYRGLEPLINMLKQTSKNYNIDKIRDAFAYAEELHSGQFRQSGEPY
ncbi:MAG: hypothetical protein UHG68_09290, partial [Clostridia bacterium]|nr:hypothetical protein [Clostridia bacterium]